MKRNETGNTHVQEQLLFIIKDFKEKTGVYPYSTQLIDLGYFTRQRLSILMQDLIKRKVITIHKGKRGRQITIK